MAETTIVTGQFVRISQTPASLGERFLALLIDLFLLIVYLIGMSVLLDRLNIHGFNGASAYFLLLSVYLPALCYPLLCEVFNRGQSIGKQLLNIRVVKADGSTPSLSAYLLRWLLFIIDLPLTSGLGAIVILLTKNNQRLGDLAAGTMVIKEKNYREIQVSLDEFDYLTQNYHPVYPQAVDLSLEQINVITKTLASGQSDRLRRIRQLAEKVQSLLSIVPKEVGDETFLDTLLRDYQYYALEEI